MSGPNVKDAPDLREIHDFLVSLASKAGEIITNALPESSEVDTKKNSQRLHGIFYQGRELIHHDRC